MAVEQRAVNIEQNQSVRHKAQQCTAFDEMFTAGNTDDLYAVNMENVCKETRKKASPSRSR